MADEAKAPQSGESMRTVQGLAVILIVVLAVFMVTSLNRVKSELVKMNVQMETLVTSTAQNSLAGFQAVSEDGQVQFRFTPVPGGGMLGMGGVGMCPAPGMAGEACSAGGTCAAPAAK
jgi:hypothetical protein